MNLGKLLGAGKSFFGGRGSISYREKKGVYLPKFNSGANPFVNRPAEVVAPKAELPSAAPRAVRSMGWAEKLNPFRAAPVEPAPVLKAVQPELSLDSVKVLHNDLSDADVEIVPLKSRTVTPVSAPTDFLEEPVLKAV